MKRKIRLLIVDDHFIVRIGLLTSIRVSDELTAVGEASTGAQAIEAYRKRQPDVVLMDLRLPDISGIEATQSLCKDFPGARVIMISTFQGEEDIYRSLQAGARGYLPKSVLGDELVRAIKTVYAGERYIPETVAKRLAERSPGRELTARETEVLGLLTKGLNNKEIGDILGFTEYTAKFHVAKILEKLEVADRTEAATVALERGILHLDNG
jgi:DNA-binding NarL/FixJ family response regulator